MILALTPSIPLICQASYTNDTRTVSTTFACCLPACLAAFMQRSPTEVIILSATPASASSWLADSHLAKPPAPPSAAFSLRRLPPQASSDTA